MFKCTRSALMSTNNYWKTASLQQKSLIDILQLIFTKFEKINTENTEIIKKKHKYLINCLKYNIYIYIKI